MGLGNVVARPAAPAGPNAAAAVCVECTAAGPSPQPAWPLCGDCTVRLSAAQRAASGAACAFCRQRGVPLAALRRGGGACGICVVVGLGLHGGRGLPSAAEAEASAAEADGHLEQLLAGFEAVLATGDGAAIVQWDDYLLGVVPGLTLGHFVALATRGHG